MTIQEMFHARCERHQDFVHCHDIFEHLPALERYAYQVRHITEFGTRTGNSTCAFLAGLASRPDGGEVVSYDIASTPFVPPTMDNVKWTFHQQDTGRPDLVIAPTDLLFIDSLHEYDHIGRELKHALKVSRYIIFHDTSLEWIRIGGRGVIDAVTAFLARNPQWRVKEIFENNNGLTILEKT